MSEIQMDPEGLPPYIQKVTVKDGHLGHQIRDKGAAIDLSSLFDRGSAAIRESAQAEYDAVYFRTKGDGIYRLTTIGPESEDEQNGERGLLVGPGRNGEQVAETFWAYYIEPTRGLIIDQLFTYDGDGTKYTPPVREIVGVLRGLPNDGQSAPVIPSNPIIEDFEAQFK